MQRGPEDIVAPACEQITRVYDDRAGLMGLGQ